jgi:hypothetical protein
VPHKTSKLFAVGAFRITTKVTMALTKRQPTLPDFILAVRQEADDQ